MTRKLVVIEFLSLDGVMQAPGKPDEDTSGGFRHGGWQLPYSDAVLGESAMAGMAETDAFLFGRRTYEIMAAHWPTAPADDMFTTKMNGTQKYVVSRTLREPLEWQPTTLIDGDLPAAIRQLKEQAGQTIAVLGSGQLTRSLLEHGLVDELSLAVSPLLIGSGKRLFGEHEEMRRLDLVEAKPTTTGSLILRYRPAA